MEVSLLEGLVANLESRSQRSWNEQTCDAGGILENETEVLDLTVTSPVYDIVIADFDEAVVLDMESI